MNGTPSLQRRTDLDWLRVIAVLLLVPFHAALIFLPDPTLVAYVKDSRPTAVLAPLVDFLSRWQLEVLFFVAGAASWYALGSRTAGQYLTERVRRLLIPFVFGIVTLIPLMVNLRYLGGPQAASVGQIYARFFARGSDLTGMTGGFTPAHLWFLLYLFSFSLIGLPLFRLLRIAPIQRGLERLAGMPGVIWLLYLGCIPPALARQADLVGLHDKDPLYYFLIMLAGYVLTSRPRFQEAIDRATWVSVALALAATFAPKVPAGNALLAASQTGFAGMLLFKLSQWAWLLAILGVAHRRMIGDGPVLRYASEAAMPFYMLHLPLVTLVGLFAVQLNAGILTKYILVVAGATLATLAVYDLGVKRVGVLRFCFGMKPRPAHPDSQPSSSPRAGGAAAGT